MNYKKLVRDQVQRANFPYHTRQVAREKILIALRNLRLNEKTKEYLYCPLRRCRVGLRPQRSHAGRPKLSNETNYLLSVLNGVWLQAFGKRTRLNRRGERETPFVKFASPIMRSVDIYNELDNLNKYRRYVNRTSKIIDRRGSIFVTYSKE